MTDHDRAEALRNSLLAIARYCARTGEPLPMRAELARITGARLRQIHRHVAWLKDVGALATQRRQGRLYVRVVS
jgi:hypothetical protein